MNAVFVIFFAAFFAAICISIWGETPARAGGAYTLPGAVGSVFRGQWRPRSHWTTPSGHVRRRHDPRRVRTHPQCDPVGTSRSPRPRSSPRSATRTTASRSRCGSKRRGSITSRMRRTFRSSRSQPARHNRCPGQICDCRPRALSPRQRWICLRRALVFVGREQMDCYPSRGNRCRP